MPYESKPGYVEQGLKDIFTHGKNIPLPVALMALGVSGGGIMAGHAISKMRDRKTPAEKTEERIRQDLALQELQDPGVTEADVAEYLSKKSSAGSDTLLAAILAAGSGAALAYPAGEIVDAYHKERLDKDVNHSRAQLGISRRLLDEKFRQAVMDQMQVDPSAFQDKMKQISEIEKTSMEMTPGMITRIQEMISMLPPDKQAEGMSRFKSILKMTPPGHATNLPSYLIFSLLGLAGLGMSATAYMMAKKHAQGSGEELGKMKSYKEMLDKMTKNRSRAVQIGTDAFSPEEMIALEHTKGSSIKPPGQEPAQQMPEFLRQYEPPSMDATPGNEDLKTLLSSV